MNKEKYVYNVMYYDDSYMEEPTIAGTFEDEQTAYTFQTWRYESEFYYIEREVV